VCVWFTFHFTSAPFPEDSSSEKMGTIVTHLRSIVYGVFVSMAQEEELEELVRGGFIIGKTVGQARGEYVDIEI